MLNDVHIHVSCPVKAQNAGLFVSRGNAMHPTRILDSHELIFVIQGNLKLWENNTVFNLGVGDVLHLFPHRQHGGVDVMLPDLKFYWIHFTIEHTPYPHTDKNQTLNPVTTLSQVTQLNRPEALERQFRMFINQQETGTLLPVSANLMTMLMIIEIAQQAKGKQAPSDPNPVATWAHSYIRMNYDRSISAKDVAKAVGYNVDYLGRLYRQTYGITITDAIHKRRISRASNLLLNSRLDIGQIATTVGFNDIDYFRRIFKRYNKITPIAYRAENCPLHVVTH